MIESLWKSSPPYIPHQHRLFFRRRRACFRLQRLENLQRSDIVAILCLCAPFTEPIGIGDDVIARYNSVAISRWARIS